MASRFGVVVSLVLGLQFSMSALHPTPTEAQGQEEVFVIEGSDAIEDCQVRFATATDRDFRDVTHRTNPVACPGGVAWAYRTTLADAQAQERVTATSAPQIQIVRLTGDDERDRAAIEAEMDVVHGAFDTGEGASNGLVASTVGFAAPGARFDALGTASGSLPAAATCRVGRVGEYKSSIATWTAKRPNARVQAIVFYKRITCQQWEIYRIRATLLDPPRHKVFYREFRYTKLTEDSDGRLDRHQTGCPQLSDDGSRAMNFEENIVAGGTAVHEVEDDEFNSLGFHCRELGNSYTSARITLRGGTS